MVRYVFGKGREGIFGEIVAIEIEEKDAFTRRQTVGRGRSR